MIKLPKAIIYKPAKSAMQSGRGLTKHWVLEYVKTAPLRTEPVMGWISSTDMTRQIKLTFATLEEAEAYAKQHQLTYTIRPEHQRRQVPKNYASNFI